MKLLVQFVLTIDIVILASLVAPLYCFAGEANLRLFVLDPPALQRAKQSSQEDGSNLRPALSTLVREADRALTSGTFSVVNKHHLPLSGDRHDYMSLAPYWWPNPNSPNGLPYVQRDGEVNPERNKISDRQNLVDMIARVKTLGLAYFFTDKEIYADHAAKLLRVWFLDDETKMNPHLRYAQAVPGRSTGSPVGIIETHDLPALIDALGMLARSKNWDQRNHRALQGWFNAYLSWLLESPEGRAEGRAQNNHGSWYDVQTASFALFVQKESIAKKIVRDVTARRIAKQIERDGRQSRELQRTQAWSYSLFNLEALFDAAAIADKLGVDLWNYETPDKRAIRKALDWLLPFAAGDERWSYQEISGWQPGKLAPLLRRAAIRYHEPSYEEAIRKLPAVTVDHRMHLLYPTPSRR
jgi:hypothetical protein